MLNVEKIGEVIMKRSNMSAGKELMRKMDKKYERREKMVAFFMAVVSTPLCILFRTVAFIAKIIGVIASFALCYAIYRGYILFNEHNMMVAAEIVSELVYIAKIAISPFIAFLISHISDRLQQYFYLYSSL